jgi:hypothetical protein
MLSATVLQTECLPGIVLAHKHSSAHRQELMASGICGCFYCLKIFEPTKVNEWTDYPPGTQEGQELVLGTTALCPCCGIDSVIGDRSGFPITGQFLAQMKQRWFGSSK